MNHYLIIATFCLLLIISTTTAIEIPSKIEQDFNAIDSGKGIHNDEEGGIMGKAGRVVRDAVEGVADTLNAGDAAAREALIKNTPAKTKSEV